MKLKEIIITSVIALMIGIILVHYEKGIENDQKEETAEPVIANVPSSSQSHSSPAPITPSSTPPTIVNPLIKPLTMLTIPNPSITIALWFDQPEQTQFAQHEKTTLYYEIKEIAQISPCAGDCYFTLFNLSPTGKFSILLKNEPIMLNTLKDKRLGFLEVGQEYFKAIVTSQPIVSWLSFLNSDITQASEYETLLATKTLQLSVVSYQSSVISYQLSVISHQSSVINKP